MSTLKKKFFFFPALFPWGCFTQKKKCWWMNLSYNVSCWQLRRYGGAIYSQLVEISSSDVPDTARCRLPDLCLVWKTTGTPELWNHRPPLVFDDLDQFDLDHLLFPVLWKRRSRAAGGEIDLPMDEIYCISPFYLTLLFSPQSEPERRFRRSFVTLIPMKCSRSGSLF